VEGGLRFGRGRSEHRGSLVTRFSVLSVHEATSTLVSQPVPGILIFGKPFWAIDMSSLRDVLTRGTGLIYPSLALGRQPHVLFASLCYHSIVLWSPLDTQDTGLTYKSSLQHLPTFHLLRRAPIIWMIQSATSRRSRHVNLNTSSLVASDLSVRPAQGSKCVIAA
jgi:hypothetical protein